MKVTQYPEINKLLGTILFEMQKILGKKLVGLYLYGSLVCGDFEQDISDIDLVAALSSNLNNEEFKKLAKMHNRLVEGNMQWNDRIEICYLSVSALKAIKSYTGMLANISPGEPFHKLKNKKQWLVDWYMIRKVGIAIFGPDPNDIIESISEKEFVEAVKENTKAWNVWVKTMHNRKAQAYAVLTLCRAFYANKFGEQPSKKQAALWTQQELPQWSELIQKALDWRLAPKEEDAIDDLNYPQTVKFVNYIRDQILLSSAYE